jgi:hypothetical protein
MTATVEVSNLSGTVRCHKCGKAVAYDLRGLPPGVSQRCTCQCGAQVKVKRSAFRSSLGPSEVKL